METRANFVLIGAFTLAVVAAAFGFVYWFQATGGPGERATYRVVFEGSVSGLRTGGAVLFNGIRVGEVTRLTLNPKKPEQVVATIGIDKSVAVRPDTAVGLEFQGLTGIASLSLRGGSPDKPALVGSKDNPPVLTAPPGATQDITEAARDALRRLDDFVAANQKAFHSAAVNIDKFTGMLTDNSRKLDSTLGNLEKFSGALARNSERLDKITEGMQNLTGGADGKSGEINEAAKSIRRLADHLDKRTAEISDGINRFTRSSTKQMEAVGASARHMLQTIERNPSRLIFGGPSAN